MNNEYFSFLSTGVFMEISGVAASWDDIMKYTVLVLISIASRFAYAWIDENFVHKKKKQHTEETEQTEEIVEDLKDEIINEK